MLVFYSSPHTYLTMSGKREVRPNMFDIYSYDTMTFQTEHICTMSNRGDRLNNILKRGIPLADARKIFYEMDS